MAAQINELKCYRCRLKLPTSYFSKNARKQQEPDCKRCTAWAETLEPGDIPPALETGHISVEEKLGDMWFDGDVFYEDNEGDIEGTIDGMSVYGTADDASSVVTSSASVVPSEAASHRSTLPPHLRKSSAAPSSYAPSEASTTTTTQTLPPHIRRKALGTLPINESTASVSSAASASNLGPGSVSTATTIREDRVRAAVPFNSWDSFGAQHTGVKVPTVVTKTASATSQSETIVTTNTNWTKRFPKAERLRECPAPMPHIQSDLAKAQINEERAIGFHTSDNEWDSDDDDWM